MVAELRPGVIRDYVKSLAYYNGIRSHTECGHLPPTAKPPDELATVERDKIVVRTYVGGLVKAFERKAA